MRKDVRIGLSIGGVLLAVLIVYLLVPKDPNPSRNAKNQQVAQGGTSGASGEGATGQGAAGGNSATPGNGAAGSESTAPPGSPAEQTPGMRQGENSLANGGSSSQPGGGAEGATTDPGAGQADASKPDANKGVDWASLLDRGIMPESLVATNPPAKAGDIFEDGPKRNGQGGARAGAAPAGPQDPIVWPAGNPNQPDAGANGGATAGAGTSNTTGNTTGTPAGASNGTPSGTAARTGGTPPAPGATGPLKDHTVQPHETFSTIALMIYGDARHYKDIQKANPNVDERRLRPGMVIKLPDVATVKAGSAVTAGATAKAEAPVDPGREYRVQPNDSLHKIALKLYGKATKADAIYEANKEKIGPDSHRIKVGMVLKLPETPTVSPTANR